MRPDIRTLEAFARLQNDQDFAHVLAWAEQSLVEATDDLVMSKDANETLRLQGACLVWRALVNTARNARDSLSKTGKRPVI